MSYKILLLVTVLLLTGCQHTDSDQVGVGLTAIPENSTPENVSFHVEQATLSFNGKVLSERLTLSQERFGFFFLWVKNEGLFVVTIYPLSIAVLSGRFTENKIFVEYKDHKIELTSQSEHIFGDFKDRDAYLIYVDGFDMFGPDVKPADTVIGAVSELNQIPRYAN